jgi:hypothetical protein
MRRVDRHARETRPSDEATAYLIDVFGCMPQDLIGESEKGGTVRACIRENAEAMGLSDEDNRLDRELLAWARAQEK